MTVGTNAVANESNKEFSTWIRLILCIILAVARLDQKDGAYDDSLAAQPEGRDALAVMMYRLTSVNQNWNKKVNQ
ncbi:hypothetical protein CU097_012871 [Rhizopus azygosporus]|uniref:Uncharacterized protein n=1 Tax=Rhizopus azygosporus TaxID=86630 RepID=A0A367JQI2_RHIAZ|nr:hypothetical protein CU097_012871 [Rhizopus azygosporus]